MVERRREGAIPETTAKKPAMVYQRNRQYVTLVRKNGGGAANTPLDEWERMKKADGADVFSPMVCASCRSVIVKTYLGTGPGGRLRFREECDHTRALEADGKKGEGGSSPEPQKAPETDSPMESQNGGE